MTLTSIYNNLISHHNPNPISKPHKSTFKLCAKHSQSDFLIIAKTALHNTAYKKITCKNIQSEGHLIPENANYINTNIIVQ